MANRAFRLDKKNWLLWLILLVLVVIVAIVVPVTVVTHNKDAHHVTDVIIPLYIYPQNNDTWAPLYSAVAARPELQYTVILNVNSGPGSSSTPDSDYASSIMQLNAYTNVRTVGYVRTGYATRPQSDVLADITTYAGWAAKDSRYAMHGIFLDESPHQADQSAASYMRTVTSAIKDSSGLLGDKLVIRNPGTIPDPIYDDQNTDIVVAFESSYSDYQNQKSALAKLPQVYSHYCFMINSVPSLSTSDLQDFIKTIRASAKHLFLTSNTQNYYESFAADWSSFTQVLPIKRSLPKPKRRIGHRSMRI